MKPKPVNKEPSDVYTVLPDGTKTNREIMNDLLLAPAPETPADYKARRSLYMKEFSISAEEFAKYYA